MAVENACIHLYEAAKCDGSELILENFRPQYLSYAFELESGLWENRNQTPATCAVKLLEKMKVCAATFEKLNRLHETMDRKHFEELVRSDNAFVTSGGDNEKGRKIIFLRTGHIFKGIWQIKAGTPRGDAFVAAVASWFEAAIANIALDAKGEEFQTILISDLSEAGCLDFNPQLQSQLMEILVRLLLPVPPLVLIVSAPVVSRLFMKIISACVPEDQRKNMIDVPRREDIEKYIGSSDTPSWFYAGNSESKGVPHCANNQRTTWHYAANVRKGSSVTLAEIWNPGPWLDSDNNISGDSGETRRLFTTCEGEHSFGSIEDDPDDDW